MDKNRCCECGDILSQEDIKNGILYCQLCIIEIKDSNKETCGESHMTAERDRLVEELKKIVYFPKDSCWEDSINDLAEFILADRKRICEPLVNYAKLKSQELVVRRKMGRPDMFPEAYEIIIETLKLSGIEVSNDKA